MQHNIRSVSKTGQVTIPKQIRDNMGLSMMDYVDFFLTEDNLLAIRKAQPGDKKSSLTVKFQVIVPKKFFSSIGAGHILFHEVDGYTLLTKLSRPTNVEFIQDISALCIKYGLKLNIPEEDTELQYFFTQQRVDSLVGLSLDKSVLLDVLFKDKEKQ